jgi:hypothetical protein
VGNADVAARVTLLGELAGEELVEFSVEDTVGHELALLADLGGHFVWRRGGCSRQNLYQSSSRAFGQPQSHPVRTCASITIQADCTPNGIAAESGDRLASVPDAYLEGLLDESERSESTAGRRESARWIASEPTRRGPTRHSPSSLFLPLFFLPSSPPALCPSLCVDVKRVSTSPYHPFYEECCCMRPPLAPLSRLTTSSSRSLAFWPLVLLT